MHSSSVLVGPVPPHDVFTVCVELRRRVGHDPIPDFSTYVNCPRVRLSEADFIARYGADANDVVLIDAHYRSHGLSGDYHLARRHAYLTGTTAQHERAFGVTLQHYMHPHTGIHFRGHTSAVVIPSALQPLVMRVSNLQNEPPYRAPAFSPPPYNNSLSPATMMAIYNMPTASASGQTIGIGRFSGWGTWLLTDIQSSCNLYNLPTPSITSISVTTITPGTSPEATLDISMCGMFGQGANLVVFDSDDLLQIVARAVHPNTGETACTMLSFSYAAYEGLQGPNRDSALEDAAIQGVTILASSGDWGITDASGDISALWPGVNPYVTCVGGTAIGRTTSGVVDANNFVEWSWNQNQSFYGVTGGGVSVNYPKPNFQNNLTLPASLTTEFAGTLPAGTTGRGVPDIAGVADGSGSVTPIYYNGNLVDTGGTSSSAPMMAGMLTRVNAALGRNVGFINPTLYSGDTAFMRKLNSGGPVDNTMVNSSTSPRNPSVTFTGYSVTLTGWNACVGLGMINGNALVTYLTSHTQAPVGKEYWVIIQPVNSAGAGSATQFGPIASSSSAP